MKKLLLTAIAFFAMATASLAQVTFECTAGQGFGGNEGCQKIFDGNVETKWCTGPGNNAYALFTASQPVFVWAYEFTTANDNEQYGRMPRGWKLYGTNDENVASDAGNSAWVEISGWENDLVQRKNFATFRFYIENAPQTAYKYFKLVITKSSDSLFQISEFALCYNTDANIVYNWVAGTNDGMKKLIDKKVGQKAEGGDMPDGAWITIETADQKSHTVKQYSMTTHDDGSWNDRAPKNWIVEGSNDNATWETIDEVTNDPIDNLNYTTFDFTPANLDGAYRYVRLTIRNYKGGYHQLAEFFVNAGCEGHNWVLTEGKDATCVEDGGAVYSCTVCGAQKTIGNIPATGNHNYVDHYCTVCHKPEAGFVAEEDGYYLVKNAEELEWLAALLQYPYEEPATFNVKLTADVDAAGFAGFGNGDRAREFKGEFDGQGHYITNLRIEEDNKNVGFFGNTNGANIHDLGFKNAYVKITEGKANNAVLVGNATNTTINRVAVLDSYVEGHDHVGAIAGNTVGQTVIKNSLSNAEIKSRTYQAGGLVGTSNGLTLENSLFSGSVQTGWSNAAGLVSLVDSENAPTTLRHNLSAATTVKSGDGGEAAGLVVTAGRPATFVENYVLETTLFNGWTSEYLDQLNGVRGLGVSEEEVKTKAFYAEKLAWDLENDWQYVVDGYPVLAWMENPNPEPELLYTVNGVVGDPYGMGMFGEIVFDNTAIGAEVWSNNTVVIKNWDGTEGSDLRVAYYDDENWGPTITTLTQIVDGEELETELTEDEYGDPVALLFPQSAVYPMAAIYLENSSLILDNEEQVGQFMLYGQFYKAAAVEYDEDGLPVVTTPEPEEKVYLAYWPGEPVAGPELGEPIATVDAAVNYDTEDRYEVTVDLYANALVVKAWAGVEGNDLYVKYNELGEVTYIANIVDGTILDRNLTTDRFGLTWQILETGHWDSTVNVFINPDNTATYTDSYADVTVSKGEVKIFMQDADDDEVPFTVAWGEVVTAITNATAADDAARYNIAGQKVSDTFKGIVIRNGKKMLNK